MKFWIGIFSALSACSACGSNPGIPKAADYETYTADQVACVQMATSRAEADGCRMEKKAAFCSKFPSLDTCQPAGGTIPALVNPKPVEGGI